MQSAELQHLIYQIELKRRRMEENAQKYGMDHPLVICYSQSLDRLINQYNHLLELDAKKHRDGHVKEPVAHYALA
ncbi:aspartyl-phosphate phosphatase Spo0E family protein [Rubeoparvulum massiliense]|uniref:aspartyl-phosphate phosphatase Spo0E family protein n=1 Tax=Rubeoparvulum massiliense TaxID=1631346 RepID=UPI00065E5A20|nr:aspartyl-phosphate phosphatase Spo0E family protein [Rubeoparvulum massiliense]